MLEELVLGQRCGILIPIVYTICFVMAYYGTNAAIIGNTKLSIWHYQAVTNVVSHITNEGKLIAVDTVSFVITMISMWFVCKMNVFKALFRVQSELWLIMGIQEGFSFVRVSKV